MAQLYRCNPCQTGDGVSDELATRANWRDCQGGNCANQANHEKVKIRKSRGQIWSSRDEPKVKHKKSQPKEPIKQEESRIDPKDKMTLQVFSLQTKPEIHWSKFDLLRNYREKVFRRFPIRWEQEAKGGRPWLFSRNHSWWLIHKDVVIETSPLF